MNLLLKKNELNEGVDSLRIKKNYIYIYNKYNQSFIKNFLNLNKLKRNKIRKYELFSFFLFKNFLLALFFYNYYIKIFNFNIKKNILSYSYKYKENRLKYNKKQMKFNFHFLIFIFKLFRVLFLAFILKKNLLKREKNMINDKFTKTKYFVYYKFGNKKNKKLLKKFLIINSIIPYGFLTYDSLREIFFYDLGKRNSFKRELYFYFTQFTFIK
jgi:hypothetical protein